MSSVNDLKNMSNAIRALSIDAIERANSGHPGMPLGMADVATVLFSKFLKYDPSMPNGLTEIGLFYLLVTVLCYYMLFPI